MTDSIQLYKPFKRLFNGPMDVDTVFNSYESALLHAKSNISYNGEVVKVLVEDKVFMYTIFEGELIKIPINFSAKDVDHAISTVITQKENGIEISTKLKVSSKNGNIITVRDDGLYATVQNVTIYPEVISQCLPSIVARKFTINIGDGLSKDVQISHNLDTPRVSLTVWTNETPAELVICDVSILDNNNIIIHFDNVPAKDEFSAIIIG